MPRLCCTRHSLGLHELRGQTRDGRFAEGTRRSSRGSRVLIRNLVETVVPFGLTTPPPPSDSGNARDGPLCPGDKHRDVPSGT